MAMTASATAPGLPKLCYSHSDRHRLKPATNKFTVSTKFFSTTILKAPFPIRASDPQKDTSPFTSQDLRSRKMIGMGTERDGLYHFTNTKNTCGQEDLNYLWKLGAGSVAGAAVIKYGSILFPEITNPNISEALLMISTPVIIAVLLLIRHSRVE